MKPPDRALNVTTLHVNGPFGSARLELTASGGSLEEVRAISVPPTIWSPTLDGCALARTTWHAEPGDQLALRWAHELAAHWAIGAASGQYFEGWEASHPDGAEAAFGFRSYDYYEWESPLQIETLVDGFALTAMEDTKLMIGLAAAWIDRPTNEDERVAPWFAADVTLEYQEAKP